MGVKWDRTKADRVICHRYRKPGHIARVCPQWLKEREPKVEVKVETKKEQEEEKEVRKEEPETSTSKQSN